MAILILEHVHPNIHVALNKMCALCMWENILWSHCEVVQLMEGWGAGHQFIQSKDSHYK